MPVYLKTAGYKVYIWTNEKNEPVHFHVTKGDPSEHDTKIWVLANGSFQLAHNKGRVPQKDLTRIFSTMESYYFTFIDFWKSYFGEIKFYS